MDSVFDIYSDKNKKASGDGNTSVGKIENETATKLIATQIDKMSETLENANNQFGQLKTVFNDNQLLPAMNHVQSMVKDLNEVKTLLSNNSATSNDLSQYFSNASQDCVKMEQMFTNLSKSSENISKMANDKLAASVSTTSQDVARQAQELKNNLSQIMQILGQVQNAVTETTQATQGATQDLNTVNSQIGQTLEQQKNSATINQTIAQNLGKISENTRQQFDSVMKDLSERAGNYEKLNLAFGNMISDANQIANAELVTELENLQQQLSNDDKDGSQQSIANVSRIVEQGNQRMEQVAKYHEETKANSVANYRKLIENIKATEQSITSILQQKEDVLGVKNADGFKSEIESLRNLREEVSNQAKTQINTIMEQQKKAISEAINIQHQNQNGAVDKNSSTYDLVTSQIMNGQIQGINYDKLVHGVDDALMGLEQSRGKNSPWYQYVTTGNLLGDKTELESNLRNVQRHGYAAQQAQDGLLKALTDDHLTNAQKAQFIGQLQGAHSPLIESIKKTASGMNFSTGGGKGLTEQDKKVLDAFKVQVESALDNLTKSINAIEAHDPNDATLKQLREEQKVLQDIKDKADKASESSSALSNIFSTMWSGLKKFKNILASGLSLLGLGGLLNPLTQLKAGIEQEEAQGKRRYRAAKLDFYMGTGLNGARMIDSADTQANYYWRITNGMISEDEFLDYNSALAHGVGGHYGESQEKAASDMHNIAKQTMAFIKTKDISTNSAADFYKNFYKDAGMSAEAASAALVSVAQTATTANVPVEKYVNMVSQMAASLRNQGISAEQVQGSINALVRKGLRPEDAQSMVGSFANANQNMAKDMNASAFWGMMAGQGGDPFSLIAAGYKSHNADGSVNKQWANMMGQRVFAEMGFMATIGGMDNPMGQSMAIDTLTNRGYGRKDASMIVDALSKGDNDLVADLFQKAEDHKDGGKAMLAEAADEAVAQLKQAGNQVSVFQKISTDMVEMQKKIGNAIRDYLSGPLEKFREGFGKVLDTIVDWSKKLIDAVTGLLDGNSTAGKALSLMGDNPGTTFLGAVGTGALLFAGARGLKSLGSKAVNKIAGGATGSVISKAGKLARGGSMGLGMLGAGLALGVGGVALTQLVKMFSDGTATVTAKEQGTAAKNAMDNIIPTYNADSVPEYSSPDLPNDIVNDGFESPNHYMDVINGDFRDKGLQDEINDYQVQDPYKWNEGTETLADNSFDMGMALAAAGYAGSAMFTRNGKAKWLRNKRTINQNLKNLKEGGRTLRYDGISLGTRLFAGSSYGKSLWGNMAKSMKGLKGAGALGAALTVGGDVFSEYQDAKDNPDRFTSGQRAGRVAFKSGGALAGGAVGGFLGSALGPLGTMGGAWAGSMVGGWAGEKLMNSQVGAAFGLADWQGNARQNEKKVKDYENSVRQSEELYGDASKSILNSNNENHKAVGKALGDHGIKVEDVTREEEQYMNDLFNELKSKGFNEQLAAYLAASQISIYKEQSEFANQNDKKSLAENARDYATKSIFKDLNPNEHTFAEHNYGALGYTFATLYGKEKYDTTERTNVWDTFSSSFRYMSNENITSTIGYLKDADLLTLWQKYKGSGDIEQRQKDFYDMLNNGRESEGNDAYDGYYGEQLAGLLALGEYVAAHPDCEVADDFASKGLYPFRRDNESQINAIGAENLQKEDGTAKEKANQILKNPYTLAPKINPSRTGLREKFRKTVREQLGKTYVFGKNGPEEFDCSGLMEYGGKQAGLTYFGRQANNQYDFFKGKNALKKSISELTAGDLMFFKGDNGEIDHVGMYDGNGKIVHASSTAGKVLESDINSEWYRDHFVAGGDLSAVGAEAGAGDGGGGGEQKTVAEVMGARASLYDAQMKQIGEFAGLKDKELLNDKIATGQYILDGVSALSANGNYMSIRGVRDSFRLNSGVKDKDLFGVGLKGAFSGDGKMLSDAGVLEMDKRLSKQAGEKDKHTYHLKGYEAAQKYSSEMDKIAEEMHEAHKAQVETYEKEKEEKEKAIEKMDKSKQTAKISITVIGSDGKEKKVMATEDELRALIAQQKEMIAQLHEELKQRG